MDISSELEVALRRMQLSIAPMCSTRSMEQWLKWRPSGLI